MGCAHLWDKKWEFQQLLLNPDAFTWRWLWFGGKFLNCRALAFLVPEEQALTLENCGKEDQVSHTKTSELLWNTVILILVV